MKKVSFIMKALLLCLGMILLSSLNPRTVDAKRTPRTSNNTVRVETDENDLSRIKLNVSSKTLVKDDSYTLSVYCTTENQKVSFSSDDADIVSVEELDDEKKCIITGLKVGTTTITVNVKEGTGFLAKTVKTLTCEVTVGPPALSIKFLQDSVTVRVGERVNLYSKLEMKPGNSTELPVYSVRDALIGSMSSSGYFSAKTAGKTVVTAEIKNGLSAKITVIVKAEEESETKTD